MTAPKPTPRVQAALSYPNDLLDGWPGQACVYTCPFSDDGHIHFTLIPTGAEFGETYPPCGDMRKPRRVFVSEPPPERQFAEPPFDLWDERFEAERRRARGGRPLKEMEVGTYVA